MGINKPSQFRFNRRQGFYVPVNFDAEAIVGKKHKDEANYLVSRIRWGQITWQADKHGYVPLMAKLLHKVIDWRIYMQVKKALINGKVIECDDHYITTERATILGCEPKSYGFRLGPDYKDQPTHRIECGNNTLARKIHHIRDQGFKKLTVPVHRYLLKQLQALEVDQAQAQKIINGLPDQDYHRAAIQAIVNHEWDFTTCRYGRVHTNITRLSAKLRPAIRVKGQRLLNIDIANSQPLFFGLLLINYRRNKSLRFGEFKKAGNPYATAFNPYLLQLNDKTSSPLSLPAIMIHNLVEVQRITGVTEVEDFSSFLATDELQFLRLCEAGQFYQFVREGLRAIEFPLLGAFKPLFFEAIFFGKNRASCEGQKMLKELFADLFPTVDAVMRKLKRKDHAFLACLMQHYEACFMINAVCRRLMKNLPDAPVFTIHDSILTTEAYIETIKQIMEEEFAFLGLHPTIRVKEC
jgi:hypothetical protein